MKCLNLGVVRRYNNGLLPPTLFPPFVLYFSEFILDFSFLRNFELIEIIISQVYSELLKLVSKTMIKKESANSLFGEQNHFSTKKKKKKLFQLYQLSGRMFNFFNNNNNEEKASETFTNVDNLAPSEFSSETRNDLNLNDEGGNDEVSVVSFSSNSLASADLENPSSSASKTSSKKKRNIGLGMVATVLIIVVIAVSVTKKSDVQNPSSVTDTNDVDDYDETNFMDDKTPETNGGIFEHEGENYDVAFDSDGEKSVCGYESVDEVIKGEIYNGLNVIDLSTVSHPDTSQQNALVWMMELDQDTIDVCDTYRVIELYILAMFYYSTNGEEWSSQMNFLSSTDPCTWNGSNNNGEILEIICGGQDKFVTSISIRKYFQQFCMRILYILFLIHHTNITFF